MIYDQLRKFFKDYCVILQMAPLPHSIQLPVLQVKPLPIQPARIHLLIPALVLRVITTLTFVPLHLPVALPLVPSKVLQSPLFRDHPVILNRNLPLIPAPQNRHVTENVFLYLPTHQLQLLQSRKFPLIPCWPHPPTI